MCTYSMVLDKFLPLIPIPNEPAPVPFGVQPSWPWTPAIDVAELRQLLADFATAMKAAKTVDKVLGHPDCEDIEKTRLEARVAELERLVTQRTDLRWRTGRTLGRTLYLDGRCIGMVDGEGVALDIVQTMNKDPRWAPKPPAAPTGSKAE